MKVRHFTFGQNPSTSGQRTKYNFTFDQNPSTSGHEKKNVI